MVSFFIEKKFGYPYAKNVIHRDREAAFFDRRPGRQNWRFWSSYGQTRWSGSHQFQQPSGNYNWALKFIIVFPMWCFPLRFDLVDGSWSYSSMKDENPLVSSQMYTERFWCCPLRNFQPAIFAHKQQKSGIQTKCIKTNRMRVKQICMSCRYCLWWVLTSVMSVHSESATPTAEIIDQVYPWGTASLLPHTRLPRESVPLFT